MSSHLLFLPCDHYPTDLPTKILYSSTACLPILAICPVRQSLLDFTTLTILGGPYRTQSSLLYNILQCQLTKKNLF